MKFDSRCTGPCVYNLREYLLPLPGFEPETVQPVSSRYTDCKITFVSNAPDIWKSVDVFECSQVLPDEKRKKEHTWSVRKVSDRIFLCEHLMDYNLARLHEPTLNLSAHV